MLDARYWMLVEDSRQRREIKQKNSFLIQYPETSICLNQVPPYDGRRKVFMWKELSCGNPVLDSLGLQFTVLLRCTSFGDEGTDVE